VSLRKLVVDADPLTWTMSGEPMNLYEECQEPWNAAALVKRREKKEEQAGGMPDGKRQKAMRFTKSDFRDLVID
jgi:hypothetical protein